MSKRKKHSLSVAVLSHSASRVIEAVVRVDDAEWGVLEVSGSGSLRVVYYDDSGAKIVRELDKPPK